MTYTMWDYCQDNLGPDDLQPECPCGGWDCSSLPGGSMAGCPYIKATKGLTHFVPVPESAEPTDAVPGNQRGGSDV